MNFLKVVAVSMVMLSLSLGCQAKLKEVRSKTKFGPTYKHKASNRTDSARWTVQQGIELKWNKGVKTGITYRRRDVDAGNGDNDNTVFVDFSFPIWKAKKKPSKMKKRVKKLERRIEQLEALLKTSESEHATN